jgi:hypothetical protein
LQLCAVRRETLAAADPCELADRLRRRQDLHRELRAAARDLNGQVDGIEPDHGLVSGFLSAEDQDVLRLAVGQRVRGQDKEAVLVLVFLGDLPRDD